MIKLIKILSEIKIRGKINRNDVWNIYKSIVVLNTREVINILNKYEYQKDNKKETVPVFFDRLTSSQLNNIYNEFLKIKNNIQEIKIIGKPLINAVESPIGSLIFYKLPDFLIPDRLNNRQTLTPASGYALNKSDYVSIYYKDDNQQLINFCNKYKIPYKIKIDDINIPKKYFNVIGKVQEIKIIPNITLEMVEELWSEVYNIANKINSGKSRWDIMNKYVKDYNRNSKGHYIPEEPYNNGISKIIKQGKLKQFYQDLLNYKQELNSLKEIKIQGNVSPEKIIELIVNKVSQGIHLGKMSQIMNLHGRKPKESAIDFLRRISQQERNQIYNEYEQL